MPSSQDAATKAIRLHLAAKNKKQNWLADELGVSAFWVSRRMSSAVNFDLEDLDRIAVILGTTLGDLLADADKIMASADEAVAA